MAIFNSYVSLPEGTVCWCVSQNLRKEWNWYSIKDKTGSAEEMEFLWLAEDFDQERALEVATRRLAFGIVQKGSALKCRYALLCDFFAGYLQDILSNDWLKQLQREYKLAKREREKSTGPGRGRIGWNLLTSKAICARAGKSWCFA